MSGRITSLTPQKRNPNRVNVEVAGEFAFGLQRITAAWLSIGQDLTDNDIQELLERDSAEVVHQAALRLISYKPRTSDEIRKRLEKKGHSITLIDQTIQRLVANGLINDEEYANQWSSDRAAFHPQSKRLMHWQLHQKGIANTDVESALQNIEPDEVLAYRAAQRVSLRWIHLPRMEFRQKCIGYLARRGFSYGTAKEVCDKLLTEISAENKS